jgi:hypothetical protein
MINCKFIGFRRAVLVMDKAQVNMKDCMVDWTTEQDYKATMPVVCGAAPQSVGTSQLGYPKHRILQHPALVYIDPGLVWRHAFICMCADASHFCDNFMIDPAVFDATHRSLLLGPSPCCK